MAQNITLLGASYADVPAVVLPKTGGGSARFTDVTGTTASASDVASGKYFYDALGSLTLGTASGGGGSTNLIMGVIRPDAEFVKSWTADDLVVADLGLTLPAYNTSTQTLISSQPLNDEQYTCDYANYTYYVLERMLTIPIYNVTTKGKGRFEYSFTAAVCELVDIASNSFKAILNDTKVTAANRGMFSASEARSVYWANSTGVSMVGNATYGTSQGFVAPSGSTTITPILPSLIMRGSTSYFTSEYWEAVTDIRRQYVIEIYRAPKGNLNIDGWGLCQQAYHICDCVNSSNHKLT